MDVLWWLASVSSLFGWVSVDLGGMWQPVALCLNFDSFSCISELPGAWFCWLWRFGYKSVFDCNLFFQVAVWVLLIFFFFFHFYSPVLRIGGGRKKGKHKWSTKPTTKIAKHICAPIHTRHWRVKKKILKSRCTSMMGKTWNWCTWTAYPKTTILKDKAILKKMWQDN